MPKRTKARLPEYRLLITPHTNDRTDRPVTLVVLETAQSFAAFRYELSVEEKLEGKNLTYRILGLRTPSLNLPAAGHAAFVREYVGLKGTYSLCVIGLDGAASQCTVRIAPEKVEIVNPPTGRALTVITDMTQWKD
jgi:hypothetical protein